MGNFPEHLLGGVRSAAMFFSGAFAGANDVDYVYAAGVPEVLLNDIDASFFAPMQAKFADRPGWEYVEDDAFDLARELGEQGRRFDLVVCDPFTGSPMKHVLFSHLPAFLDLTEGALVAGVAANVLEERGVVEPSPEVLTKVLSDAHDAEIVCTELVHRSDHAGGVWWSVLRRG
jgi:hypothetical protein